MLFDQPVEQVLQEEVLEGGNYKREPPAHHTPPHSTYYCELLGNVCCVLFHFVAEHSKDSLCFDQDSSQRPSSPWLHFAVHSGKAKLLLT